MSVACMVDRKISAHNLDRYEQLFCRIVISHPCWQLGAIIITLYDMIIIIFPIKTTRNSHGIRKYYQNSSKFVVTSISTLFDFVFNDMWLSIFLALNCVCGLYGDVGIF